MEHRVNKLLERISMSVLGTVFKIRFERDNMNPDNGRFFLQVYYVALCTMTNDVKVWYGRKWYLSEFMLDDEIVKTAWCAFEAAVKHETMEGFKVDGKVLFNPHVSFEELLSISENEVSRTIN